MTPDFSSKFTKAYAYDDVLLLPQYSKVLPHEVDVATRLTRHLTIKIPLLSAAMDTVTEAKMAIAIAQAGGIGIIHKNLSVDEQAREVAVVKKSEAGMVTEPVTLRPTDTLRDVREVLRQVTFSGFPVVENGKLVGMLTRRDIRFEKEDRKLVRDMMTKDLIKARKGISSSEAENLLHEHRIEKLPVVDDDGVTLLGMYTLKDIIKTEKYPSASKDSSGRLLAGAAVGVGPQHLERAEALLAAGVNVLVVDTAHGHSQGVLDAIKTIRKNFSKYNFELIGGNVATAAATEALIEAGVDAVKVGIGPGSICTTRIVAGIGVPQLSAVMECAHVARKKGIPVIADGGIKFSGDIVKALAAGAETVMIGALLAGTEEAPGDIILYQGRSYKQYRGMGSMGAMKQGSKDRYFQAGVEDANKLVPEGVEGQLAYRGPLANTVHQLLGGLRAGMGYVGAKNLEDLYKNAKFVEITAAGLRESHVHDIHVTREAPNYQPKETL